MPDYNWKQIEPLSDEDRGIDLAAISPLYDTWKIAKQRLEKSMTCPLQASPVYKRVFLESRRRGRLARKRFTAEQLVIKLREAEVPQFQGRTVGQVCKQIGVTEQTTGGGRRTGV